MGVWEATKAVVVRTEVQPEEEMDVLQDGGAATLVVNIEGFFVMALIPETDSGGQVYTGTFTIDQGDLDVVFDTSP